MPDVKIYPDTTFEVMLEELDLDPTFLENPPRPGDFLGLHIRAVELIGNRYLIYVSPIPVTGKASASPSTLSGDQSEETFAAVLRVVERLSVDGGATHNDLKAAAEGVVTAALCAVEKMSRGSAEKPDFADTPAGREIVARTEKLEEEARRLRVSTGVEAERHHSFYSQGPA